MSRPLTPIESRAPRARQRDELGGDAGRGAAARVLFISQNRPLPRRNTYGTNCSRCAKLAMRQAAICPQWDGAEAARFERRDGIDIFRYPQPIASGSATSYLHEYAVEFRAFAGSRDGSRASVASTSCKRPIHRTSC